MATVAASAPAPFQTSDQSAIGQPSTTQQHSRSQCRTPSPAPPPAKSILLPGKPSSIGTPGLDATGAGGFDYLDSKLAQHADATRGLVLDPAATVGATDKAKERSRSPSPHCRFAPLPKVESQSKDGSKRSSICSLARKDRIITSPPTTSPPMSAREFPTSTAALTGDAQTPFAFDEDQTGARSEGATRTSSASTAVPASGVTSIGLQFVSPSLSRSTSSASSRSRSPGSRQFRPRIRRRSTSVDGTSESVVEIQQPRPEDEDEDEEEANENRADELRPPAISREPSSTGRRVSDWRRGVDVDPEEDDEDEKRDEEEDEDDEDTQEGARPRATSRAAAVEIVHERRPEALEERDEEEEEEHEAQTEAASTARAT